VARGIYTGPFIDDVAGLPESIAEEVRVKCESAENFPGVGSSLIEPSLRHTYGNTCLKLLVPGYEVLYERVDAEDVIVFLGVIPQRTLR
jgi:hypothetical protein